MGLFLCVPQACLTNGRLYEPFGSCANCSYTGTLRADPPGSCLVALLFWLVSLLGLCEISGLADPLGFEPVPQIGQWVTLAAGPVYSFVRLAGYRIRCPNCLSDVTPSSYEGEG